MKKERKLKVIHNELQAAKEKLAEVEKMRELAEAEEAQLIAEATEKIDEICENSSIFVGVILTRSDIVAIFDLFMKTGENVTIPYRIYIKE